MNKWLAATAVVVAGMAIMSPNAAHAGTKTVLSVDYCSSGTYQGVGTNAMTNGTLRMGWCKSSGEIRTVTVRYDKTAGSAVTVKHGWRTANRYATETGPVHWDSTSNNWGTVYAGQSWSYREFPAATLLSIRPCVQGVMSVGDRTYITHTVC